MLILHVSFEQVIAHWVAKVIGNVVLFFFVDIFRTLSNICDGLQIRDWYKKSLLLPQFWSMFWHVFSVKSYQWKISRTSMMSAPTTCTFAPYFRHWFTFMIGALIGIHTVTGTFNSRPWYASANAWFPAEAAITPNSFCC